jgi:hypothetical protein
VLAAAAAAGNDSTDEDWRRAAGRTTDSFPLPE